MLDILGHAAVAAGVDLARCPWMEAALQKFRTQQPSRSTERSSVFEFLDTVKDRSKPRLEHVQHWTGDRCTDWCSAFVNWCLRQAHYEGTDDALALTWRQWGQPVQAHWGCIAVVTSPIHHVGFYIIKRNNVYILGGNQKEKHHPGLYSVNIRGFKPHCRIEYRMPSTPVKAQVTPLTTYPPNIGGKAAWSGARPLTPGRPL